MPRHEPFKKGNPGSPGPVKGGARRWLKGMVTEALKKKLASLDKNSRRVFASLIADRMVRCITHPDPDHDKTVIFAFNEIMNRVEGRPAQQINVDVTHELDVRSDAELKYFLKYGTWPDLDIVEATPVEVEAPDSNSNDLPALTAAPESECP